MHSQEVYIRCKLVSHLFDRYNIDNLHLRYRRHLQRHRIQNLQQHPRHPIQPATSFSSFLLFSSTFWIFGWSVFYYDL